MIPMTNFRFINLDGDNFGLFFDGIGSYGISLEAKFSILEVPSRLFSELMFAYYYCIFKN